MIPGSRSTASRILVIEDNVTTSRSLVLFLQTAGYDTECAFTGSDGLDLATANRFSLILLDLMLPDVSGFEICRSVRETSQVPIVILSARSADEDIVRGLELGADDYVCKPFSAEVLVARIGRCLTRSLAGNQGDDPEQTIAVRDLTLEVDRCVLETTDERVRLTRSECAILRTLMEQPGRIFTRDQLIQRALGTEFDGSDRTIDTHIWSLRRKLGEPKGRPRYILSEVGIGYRFNEADS